MIKRSAILLLLFATGSIGLLLFTFSSAAASANPQPVKCSGRCPKKTIAPVHWNIISPTMFPSES